VWFVRALIGFLSVLSLAPGHIGSGDSVQPRNTVSVITDISPALPDGVRVSIVGGDTFVRIESDGVRIEVHGYDDEQYLRISPEGVVEVNEASMTAVLNGDRYGNVDVSNVDTSGAPRWKVTGTNGVAMWHDHRSHWMSPKPPSAMDTTGRVLDWKIPLIVAGKRILMSGTLYVRDKPSIAWWLLGIPAMLLTFALAMMRRRLFLWVAVVVAVAGVMVGYLEFTGLPDGARITPVLMMFSAGTLVVAGLAVGASRRDGNHHIAVSLNAGAGAALVIVAWLCSGQVRAAYVPGLDWPWMARVVVPVMLGAGIVTAFDGIARIARPLPKTD
jgi:hypothetical protein